MATRREHPDDSGFSPVELLVVFVVMGLLAAIAVPHLLRQREKAYATATVTDLRNAASSAEASYDSDRSATAGWAGHTITYRGSGYLSFASNPVGAWAGGDEYSSGWSSAQRVSPGTRLMSRSWVPAGATVTWDDAHENATVQTAESQWFCIIADNVKAPGAGPWFYSNVSGVVSTTRPAAPAGFPGPADGFCPTESDLAAASTPQE